MDGRRPIVTNSAARPIFRNSRVHKIGHFEGLVDLGKPFGPVGSAAAAALVERQLQLPQQAGDLFSRRCVPHMGGVPRVASSRLSSAVSPRGKNSR